MANYEEKKDKALDKIAETVNKLDERLSKIETLEEKDTKKHSLKKWYEGKKAVHEIKHILHKEGKYEKYDEKELEKIEKENPELKD